MRANKSFSAMVSDNPESNKILRSSIYQENIFETLRGSVNNYGGVPNQSKRITNFEITKLVHLSLKSDFLIIVDFLICLYKSIIVGISQVQRAKNDSNMTYLTFFSLRCTILSTTFSVIYVCLVTFNAQSRCHFV